MTTDASGASPKVELRILEARAVDEMVGKIRAASSAPGAATAVASWRAEHGVAGTERGHDHAVVGDALMFLDDAPDGMLVPHEVDPDGAERIFTDAAHADLAY